MVYHKVKASHSQAQLQWGRKYVCVEGVVVGGKEVNFFKSIIMMEKKGKLLHIKGLYKQRLRGEYEFSLGGQPGGHM